MTREKIRELVIRAITDPNQLTNVVDEIESRQLLKDDQYMLDGIFLPVTIIPIANTENKCEKCKGVGKTCDEGGSFVYCDILNHYAMQESGLELSGDSNNGCNNFKSK